MTDRGTRLPGWADWCFRDRRTGEIVIGQWPNLPLILFGLAWALAFVLDPASRVGWLAALAARVFLAWWAGDELLRGVNPWRRVLGAGVLIYLAYLVVLGA